MTGTAAVVPLSTHLGALEFYQGLSLVEQVLLHGISTLFVATLLLGLLPLYGKQSVRHARRHPIAATILGLPVAAGLAATIWLGVMLSESGLGFVVGVPMVLFGLTLLPPWAAIGFVAAGQTITNRLAIGRFWVAVVVAGLLGALVPLHTIAGAVLLTVLSALGVGTGVRMLIRYMTTGLPEERVTPPSSKV